MSSATARRCTGHTKEFQKSVWGLGTLDYLKHFNGGSKPGGVALRRSNATPKSATQLCALRFKPAREKAEVEFAPAPDGQADKWARCVAVTWAVVAQGRYEAPDDGAMGESHFLFPLRFETLAVDCGSTAKALQPLER